MTGTVVHLLRHGEVDNPTKVLYGRLPGFRLSAPGEQMAQRAAEALAGPRRHRRQSSRSSAPSRPPCRSRSCTGSSRTDGRTDRGGQHLRGQARRSSATVRCAGPSAWRHPAQPGPAERGVSRTSTSRPGCGRRSPTRGRRRAATRPVLVSHQLPIWVARLDGRGPPLRPRPAQAPVRLASLTSFRYEDDDLVSITYLEPSADLIAAAGPEAAHATGPDVPRSRRFAASALLVGAALLTGCASASAGDGATVALGADQRESVPVGDRHHPGRCPLRPGAVAWQGRRRELLGLLVRHLPQRGRHPGARGHGAEG